MKQRDQYRDLEGHDEWRRNLPHFQIEGSTYACNFKTHNFRELTHAERSIVYESVWFLDGKKYDLHGVVVMPDHCHLVIHPLKKGEVSHSLGRIFHSLKSFTAHEIAKRSYAPVWQDERYDRVIRNEREYHEQLKYLRDNPAKEGLIQPGEVYLWLWHIGMERPAQAKSSSLSPED